MRCAYVLHAAAHVKPRPPATGNLFCLGCICSLPCLVHRLRQCIACSNTFPDYLAADFDIFCCISAHARPVALPLGWTTVGLFERLLESRGSTGTGFVAAFRDDATCGCGKCLRWPPAAYSARSPRFAGDAERSCLLAREASARAAISRRCAERERGLLRAFSLANSSGCCVVMCARRPAAW